MDDQGETCRREAGEMVIADLTEQDLLQAYALIRLLEPTLGLHVWRCRVLCDQECGTAQWAVARDRRGYIHAVFRYAVNRCATFVGRPVVTDVFAVGPAKRHALTTIEAWKSMAPQAHGESRMLPDGWVLITTDSQRF